ncbi:acyl-CoA dehydrogenase family protein, partial [Ilumatobacter sp.]|uniref:acyl-CoA dehydrogenase family protein n=1 Tax=Ilumatobacter sp. TaxID=1967498 RepID=UPI003C5F7915
MPALESTVDMYDLRMSDSVRPLYEQVKTFIREEVAPMSEEFFKLGETRTDRWSYAPGQLELLEEVKDKAKANGLWNFFLPDAETGEGLSNLDYAYIAIELGKNPLASESMNCAAPDTGNMEVLERVGTPEQKKQWLDPLLRGEIRSAYAMTEPDVASSDAKAIACQAVRDGDEWVVTGQKVWNTWAHYSQFGLLVARTNPDVPKRQGITVFACPIDAPGVTVRELVHITGEVDFNEVFLDGVRIPDSYRLGPVGAGWK